jgi:hypothetical protein
MNAEITSTNPAVKAIITGTAPQPARLAAARGVLPLPQTDLLEVLVALAGGDEAELAQNARATLDAQQPQELVEIIKSGSAAAPVLAFFAARETASTEIHEAILTNQTTPTAVVSRLARETKNGELLELVSLNQQLLIANPSIIEAIINNPYRTAEAERRATEIRREFFEKERGAQQIAAELRARGQVAAAEFLETAETELSIEDALFLAEHIEVSDAETDDSWLSLEYIEEFYEETEEQRQAAIGRILGELQIDEEEITNERVSMLNRLMRMGIKDRVKLASKGDREARNILVRDSNRIVAQAVLQNPRITEQEVEKIAAMRTVPDEILRQIATSRTWARNYTIAHNLARNPRTPVANVMSILVRLQLRDLQALSKNRNVSDNVRRQAMRLFQARSSSK